MGKRKRPRVSEEEEHRPDQESGGGREESDAREKSLYEILGVEKTASQHEIKKAYYKLALCLHPDKNPGDEEAKEKFQLLQKVMSVLGDEEKRAFYDHTDSVDDDAICGEGANNLQDFFRRMYREVTEADIEEFEASYRGSDSEKMDLKELYSKFKGNMNRLFCSMLCSDPKLDSHRFKHIIDEAISEGELNPTKAYQKWAKKISESKPPTDALVKKGKSKRQSNLDLVAVITQRRSKRKEHFNSFLSSIVANYGGQVAPEPTEEEFERARQRIESRKGNKRRK
ncbi:chaperone protein dnaJ 6-like [Dendrobium catenatum]|uniref:Chaperone protein dnaJ 6 n=1 Tax=Dendrobium catenatum TaxID=906689 RepID=A0A2I0VD91_9ASPA|nr:chaperone protein dnaJ 6-like [Dendrobium catenatum]PKU61363.1 Chaperone protein dnaJ 6 [Dendrobium catenatum]